MSRQGDNIFEEIYFNGGLDTDSDDKFIKNGDYVDALNIIKVESGSGGIIVNMKGNESVYSSLDDDILCGWAYYQKNESVILFLYSDNETSGSVSVSSSSSVTLYEGNKIVEFNPDTEASTIIIDDTVLGFQDPRVNDYFIKADILDDWLAWTDNDGRPKMINIQDVKDDIVNVSEDFLDLCVVPPLEVPVPFFGTDDMIVTNNLDGAYQFKYRYIQDDYRKSVYSKTSDVAISQIITRSSDSGQPLSSNNYIDIEFNSGSSNVRYIDFIVRDGNVGNWGKVIRIDKNDPSNVYSNDSMSVSLSVSSIESPVSNMLDDTDYFYRFFNNEARDGVSVGDKQYESIPNMSESLTFGGDNRLYLAGNTYGYALPELNVTLTPQYTIPEKTDDWLIDETEILAFTTVALKVKFDITDTILSDNAVVNPGDYVKWDFSVEVFTDSTGGSLVVDDYFTFTRRIEGVDAIGAELATYGFNVAYDSNTKQIIWTESGIPGTSGTANIVKDDTTIYNTGYNYYNGASTSYGYLNDLGFKRGAAHKLGLVYQDKYGVKTPVITNTDTTFKCESFAAEGAGLGNVQYTLNNTHPSWAASYRWMYAYKSPSFVQTFITDASAFEDDEGVLVADQIALDVAGNSALSFDDYNFEAGDLVRIVMDGDIAAESITEVYTDNVLPLKVLDVKTQINDGSNDLFGIWLIVKPSDEEYYSKAAFDLSNHKFINALIEVSKPTDITQETIYYEIGGGGICEGGVHKDWYTGNSTGYLNQGDVWVRPITRYYRTSSTRADIEPISWYIEDPFPFNKASRKDVGIGDINVQYEDYDIKYDNTVLWSNKFFQDTQVNGLSTFDFDDKIDVSDSYGKIKGLEQLGDSLVAICEKKVLSSYVGATEYTDTQGNVNVVKSTTPLSYFRAHDEWYGTSLKESILNNGRYIYFYDLYNGCVVRKAKNGLFSISGTINSIQGSYDYKMKSYFKDISESLVETISANDVFDAKCYMGFDPYYENVYITFVDRQTSINNISLIYHEPSNRWITTYSAYDSSNNVLTTHYPFTKKNLFHFNEGNGKLYKENSDTSDRCNLYGVQQEFYVKFTTHGAVNVMKIFNALGIHSDDVWEVESIEGDAGISYPNGVYSIIPSSNFIREENVYKADFLRNMKTRSSVATNYDLINGDELRHYTLRIKLTNDNTNKVELFKVDINEELSR